jgi:2-C-methyl-D-erythritol 4-phosphate cytidylyltransferase
MKSGAAAIIVAAGAGKRFGGRVPKQFAYLNGKPVFLWSVLAFKKIREFSQIILVVPGNKVESFGALQKKYGIDIARGGKERPDSVRAGLSALRPGIKIVAIQDGARPLVQPETIKASVAAAKKYGAAVVAVKARDTVKLSLKGSVARTIPRDTIWLAQTPQTFIRNVIERAYAKLKNNKITDDAQAVELSGGQVKVVPGDYSNIKLTDRRDLAIAKILVKK